MHLRTMGTLHIDGVDYAQTKSLVLLAYLSLNGPQSRERLARLFWPAATDPLNRLSVTLGRMRAVLPACVDADRDTVRTRLRTDAAVVEALLVRRRLDRALRLYRGGFLANARLPSLGEELEEWIFATRERLGRRLLGVSLERAEEAGAEGEFAAAAALAETAVRATAGTTSDPEELRRLHALLAAAGSPYAEDVRREATGLGVSLRPGRDRARALLLRGHERRSRHNVRLPSTSFVGRDAERAELAQLLRRTDRRLVTLVGAGGNGKSRLATHVASDQLDQGTFPAGVLFVALEETTTVAEAAQRIADALGAPVPPGAEAVRRLTATIGNGRMLLILDNVEQIASGARLVSALLRECPATSLLITSRERLHLRDEWVVPVGGLAYPSPGEEHVRTWPAIELFASRAQRADAAFAMRPEDVSHVASICRRTEGSPLALEMAAAWVTVMPVAAIAAEIDDDRDFLASGMEDLPPRQRSLRAVFDHSWRLLDDDERGCLRRLAVFRGGFSRAAARAVAGAGLSRLASLTAKSLVLRRSEDRFELHPLLHDYTEEKLAEHPAERTAVRARHAARMLQLAEEARPRIDASDGVAGLDSLDDAHDNLKAALAWAEETRADDELLRLVNALVDFWIRRGHHDVALRWFAKVAARGEHAHDTRLYARNLLRYAYVCMVQGDLATPASLLGTSLERFREAGDRSGEGEALSHVGILATFRCRYAEARARYEEAMEIAAEIGDERLEARLLNNLGDGHAYEGDPATARGFYERSLALEREQGDHQMVSNVLGALAMVALDEGNVPEARRLLHESLDLVVALGISYSLPTTLEQAACLATATAEPVVAARLWGAAERLRERLNAPLPPFDRSRLARWGIDARARASAPRFGRAWDEGRRTTNVTAVRVARELCDGGHDTVIASGPSR